MDGERIFLLAGILAVSLASSAFAYWDAGFNVNVYAGYNSAPSSSWYSYPGQYYNYNSYYYYPTNPYYYSYYSAYPSYSNSYSYCQTCWTCCYGYANDYNSYNNYAYVPTAYENVPQAPWWSYNAYSHV